MELYMTLEIPDDNLKDRTKFKKILEMKLKIAGCYFLLDETIDNFIKTYKNKENHGDSFSYKIKV